MKKIIIVLVVILFLTLFYVFKQINNFMAVSQGEEIAEYSNPQKALIVIDVQRDITEKDGKAVLNIEQTDKIIEAINRIINKSHKLKLIVIYIKNEFKQSIILDIVTKGALKEGTIGAEIDPRIKIINNNIYVKHIMDSFSNAKLDKFLIKNRVNHIYFTGLDAKYCVDKTVQAAFNRGYKISVIRDAIASSSDKDRDDKLEEFEQMGAYVITVDELL